MVASATPAGDANDNGFPPMPDYVQGGKTTGILVTQHGVGELNSGWGGPRTCVSKEPPVATSTSIIRKYA